MQSHAKALHFRVSKLRLDAPDQHAEIQTPDSLIPHSTGSSSDGGACNAGVWGSGSLHAASMAASDRRLDSAGACRISQAAQDCAVSRHLRDDVHVMGQVCPVTLDSCH